MSSPAAKVVSLHYYPVKSCRGVEVMSLDIGPRGPMWDREWMIVDETGNFLTQRQLPEMSRIQPRLASDVLYLNVPEEDGGIWEWEVPLIGGSREERVVEVWGTRLKAKDEGDAIADALTVFLNRKVRLVRMLPGVQRSLADKLGLPNAETGFADSMPTLLTSLDSLDDLNRRLPADKPVPINRFRSNIVISGAEGYAEDRWKRIRVGPIEFQMAKPCSRCQIINTDQETGLRATEPLKTLATYRRDGNKVLFGRYIAHTHQGTIKIGDAVQVIF